MIKIIKICKISYVLFALVSFGELVSSIIINVVKSEADIAVHTGGPLWYVPSFFSRLATVLFYYLFTIFVEKWCRKNNVE
jgi:hypothetical protein